MQRSATRKPLAAREGQRPVRVDVLVETPATRVWLAASLLKCGHVALAEREARMALHQNPESSQGHLVLGLIAMQRPQSGEAEARLRLAVRLDPSDATAWYALAQAYRRRGGLGDALGAVGNALRCCEEGRDRADLLVLQGQVLSGLGRREEAHRSLQQAIECAPDSAWAHRELAALLAEGGEWEAARRHAVRAIRLDPAAGSARDVLGDALVEAGDIGSALRQYMRSLPIRSHGCLRAAAWKQQQGHVEEALALLRLAMVFHPREVTTCLEAARLFVRLNRRAEALEVCHSALRMDPDDAEVCRLLESLQAEQNAS